MKLNHPAVAIRLGLKIKEEVGTKSPDAKTHPLWPIKLNFENKFTKWEFVKKSKLFKNEAQEDYL